MTRKGKIARLPHPIREQVNRRLQDGEEGKSIAQWLNTLPEALAVIAAEFDRQPINENNVSNWKQGGYRDWEAAQPSIDAIQSVIERSDTIKQNTPEGLIAHMTNLVSGWMAEHMVAPDAARSAREQFAAVGEWLMRLTRMHRTEFHAQRLAIERERLELLRKKTRQEFEDQCWEWAAQEHNRAQICRGFCYTEAEKERRARKILGMPPLGEQPPPADPSTNPLPDPPGNS